MMSKNDGGNSFSNMHNAMAASHLISSIALGSMDLAHILRNTRLNIIIAVRTSLAIVVRTHSGNTCWRRTW